MSLVVEALVADQLEAPRQSWLEYSATPEARPVGEKESDSYESEQARRQKPASFRQSPGEAEESYGDSEYS